ncbi:protein GUCD1 isoform X1 [Neodiprion pinetum]|uniref:Protein GUCD1 isoform X1 n=1 Tax=Neodiprion lecontei TaxID=441921 RepID=A0A6J0BV01_NEOLC|nr:protein GUCD1 isoform X1 [Neodiprion lecontei]XP_046471275.1 protein GUCD1 isoform X1 [Neodiprion pinetum]
MTGPKNDKAQHVIEVKISHIRQRFNWDCGVSCVLMVLPDEQRKYFIDNFDQVCKDEGFDKSTWSIDLCYLLKRFGVTHEYCTITFGVHPGYRGEHFYDKILHKDEDRVNKRFQEARLNNITVKRTSLLNTDLIRHLTAEGPIILLTNASLLWCDICKNNKITCELRNCFPWPVSYNGHYIVLVGYNDRRKRFLYRNPSYRERICAMSYYHMEEARKSYGTDEDVILIYSTNLSPLINSS